MPELSQKLVWAIAGIMLLGFAFLGYQFLALKHSVDAAIGEQDFEVEGKHKCGTPIEYNGYEYRTVRIGDQCWFAENLRSENYNNGDAIPSNLSDSEWSTTNSGAVSVYGEGAGFHYDGLSPCDNWSPDIDACDPAQSLEEYGRLYNYNALDNVRGLCPSGWHVPFVREWRTMEMALGLRPEAEANGTGSRGVDLGTQMKTDHGWFGRGNGANSSGFSGLPGGYRSRSGSFSNAGLTANWWSRSPDGCPPSVVYGRFLADNSEVFSNRGSLKRRYGLSVRCVRDAE